MKELIVNMAVSVTFGGIENRAYLREMTSYIRNDHKKGARGALLIFIYFVASEEYQLFLYALEANNALAFARSITSGATSVGSIV